MTGIFVKAADLCQRNTCLAQIRKRSFKQPSCCVDAPTAAIHAAVRRVRNRENVGGGPNVPHGINNRTAVLSRNPVIRRLVFTNYWRMAGLGKFAIAFAPAENGNNPPFSSKYAWCSIGH